MNIEFEVLCDTVLHVGEVKENLEIICSELRQRGDAHDRTKFEAFEFDAFVSTRPKFKEANYGSPEYQECVDAIKPAIDHHYANNRHHTAFHKDGINGMSLIDVIEMVCDWKAAARRSPNQTFEQSLSIAFKKYKIEPQLQKILENTFKDLMWA